MKILVFIAVLFFALTGITCGGSSDGVAPTLTPSPTEVSTFATYTNESHGFSLLYPSDWFIDEEACLTCGGPLVAIKAPNTCGNLTTQFEIKKDEQVETNDVEGYFDYKKGDILLGLMDYTPISEKRLIADGKDAIQHEFTYTSFFEQTVYVIALILLDNDTGWYMYCACAESCSSECEAVFDTMAGSFNLIE